MPELLKTSSSQFSAYDAFLQRFSYLFELMGSLEPSRLRSVMRPKGSLMYLYSYTHSIVRWKSILLFLDPKLRQILPIFEDLYRNACLYVFVYCDAHIIPQDSSHALFIGLVIDEVCCLRETQTLNPSLVDHLLLILKTRLATFCARTFFDRPKKLKSKSPNELLARYINFIKGATSCLPTHYRGCSRLIWLNIRFSPWTDFASTRPDSLLGLPSHPNSNEHYRDAPQTDNCCCGWKSESIPPGVRKFFDHSTHSFALYLHTGLPAYSLSWEEAFEPCKSMNMISRQLSMENVSLQKKMAIFREAMYFALWFSFHCEKQLNLYSTVNVPEDQLEEPVDVHRPLLLVIILDLAVLIYRDFWTWRGEEHMNTRGVYQLILDFSSWMEDFTGVRDALGAMRLVKLYWLKRYLVLGVGVTDYITSLRSGQIPG